MFASEFDSYLFNQDNYCLVPPFSCNLSFTLSSDFYLSFHCILYLEKEQDEAVTFLCISCLTITLIIVESFLPSGTA